MMMRVDSKLHARGVLGKFYNMLKDEWDDFPAIIELKAMGDKRSQSQNALSHVWYKVICDHVSAKGYGFIDVDSGEKYLSRLRHKRPDEKADIRRSKAQYKDEIIEKVPNTSKLSKGDMCDYMNKLYQRCLDIGLICQSPKIANIRNYWINKMAKTLRKVVDDCAVLLQKVKTP